MVSRSDISLLAVRVFALYLIAQGVISFPALVSYWRGGWLKSSQQLAYTAVIVSPVVIGLAVLAFSALLARRVLPQTETPTGPAARLSDVQSVVFATFGLLLIATTVPGLLGSYLEHADIVPVDEFEYRQRTGEARPRWLDDPMVVSQIASIVMGILLCTGASFWTRLLSKFRNLGYDKQEGAKT